MSSVNTTIKLANVVSDIDALQTAVSDVERRMDASLLGASTEDIGALRLELERLKSSLGESRNSEAFWKQELNESKEARKAQGDIARA